MVTVNKAVVAAVALAMTAALLSACHRGGPLCDLFPLYCPDSAGTSTWTCTYDGEEGTGDSECSATVDLYFALCDAGSMATEDEVQAGMVCTEGDTGSP
ncbi:MAG: hypothetical protein D6798_05645 [Deltaproteobacteria bacterium]|nr:MAG: hypothetical protein D6798_05645 [Deltaproteobacteria bacterium]